MNKKPTGGKHPRTWVSHVSLFHQPRKPPKIQILRVYIDRFHRHSYKNPTTWGLDSSRRRRISPGNHDPTHFTRKTTCRGWAPIPAVRWLPPRTRLSSSLEFAESTAILVGSKSENHLQNKCSMIIIYSIYTRILWRKKNLHIHLHDMALITLLAFQRWSRFRCISKAVASWGKASSSPRVAWDRSTWPRWGFPPTHNMTSSIYQNNLPTWFLQVENETSSIPCFSCQVLKGKGTNCREMWKLPTWDDLSGHRASTWASQPQASDGIHKIYQGQ